MVIKVPVVLTYNNKGTKEATKDLKKFDASLKKFGLARKLSLAGLTTATTALAKASISAAITEEKQAKSLSLTLKNLGKSYASLPVADFVGKLQFATGVSEDQLRPALQRLLVSTNDVAKSQDLLKLALDISAGSGKSLETVTAALSRAYLGNNTALSRLGVGLSKAELKVASFDQITAKLTETYRGQATEAAKTFGGQIAILNVAVDEAKEKVGVGLIDAIQRLSGDEGVAGLQNDIDGLANSFLGLVNIIERSISALKTLSGKNWIDNITKNLPKSETSLFGVDLRGGPLGILQQLTGGAARPLSTVGSAAKPSALGEERKAIAAGKTAVKINQQAAAAKAKELAAQRQLATSKKLAAKFDQENIAIEAALKGKLSDEDRARLMALKALKTETLADDEKALNNLEAAQKKAAAAELASIKENEAARNASIAKQKSELQALAEWLASNPLKVYATAVVNGVGITAPGDFGIPGGTNASPQTPPMTTNASGNFPSVAPGKSTDFGIPNITVNVNAGTITDENNLTYTIANQLAKFTRFGGVTTPAGFI
ncbi:MAG: hypothetical protein EB015_14835 [Methylocystaceae bacterium]|nr:hypothetical protein [Methylocystaceae bacterium]